MTIIILSQSSFYEKHKFDTAISSKINKFDTAILLVTKIECCGKFCVIHCQIILTQESPGSARNKNVVAKLRFITNLFV